MGDAHFQKWFAHRCIPGFFIKALRRFSRMEDNARSPFAPQSFFAKPHQLQTDAFFLKSFRRGHLLHPVQAAGFRNQQQGRDELPVLKCAKVEKGFFQPKLLVIQAQPQRAAQQPVSENQRLSVFVTAPVVLPKDD